MIYKNVSCKAIIAKVYRDFNPSHSGWVGNAIEWIGEGLQQIGTHIALETTTFDLEVKEFRVKIPCKADSIQAIEYECRKLPRNNAVNFNDNCKCVRDLETHPNASYSLNPNYIRTSFEEGSIKVHGLSIPVDNDGYPMIPDEYNTKEALSWYVMMKMISRGYKHHLFSYKDAYEFWQDMYPSAQNAIIAPDPDTYERFKAMWSNPIIDPNWAENFFGGVTFVPEGGVSFNSIDSPLDINRDKETGEIIQ